MNLRRGSARLALALGLLWFVFWTCAYVIHSRVAENVATPPAWSPTTKLALLVAAIVAAPWVLSGFRR